jgi:hypothetical protein
VAVGRSGDTKMEITVGNETYLIAVEDLTGLEVKAYREAVGTSPMAAFSNQPDLDVVAGLVWIVRRRTEPGLTYDDVAGVMTYGDLLVEHDGTGETADDPTDPEA